MSSVLRDPQEEPLRLFSRHCFKALMVSFFALWIMYGLSLYYPVRPYSAWYEPLFDPFAIVFVHPLDLGVYIFLPLVLTVAYVSVVGFMLGVFVMCVRFLVDRFF